MNDAHEPNHPQMDFTRLDQLIDGIVDGVASPAEWDEFRALAGTSVEPWRRLAEQQRLMKTLQAGFESHVQGALTVELPARQAIGSESRGWGITSWAPRLGWAAALLVGLAWAGSTLRHAPVPQVAVNPDRDVLLAEYLAQPHVIGELPVEFRGITATDEGDMLTYVRPIVERRRVNLYDIQLDENANPVLRETRSEPATLASRF